MLSQIGLLFLTGALWGCTNPFIRQGTKGLRSVKSKTWVGQAAAEVTFLLGNWKYVVPWLVNQSGSLVYLAAVQRAPLSLAVPVANSLAFAFTALTDAVVGTEEPLDGVSMIGVGLIALGTAFCCWDSAEVL
ncbi:transmembrane protein 234 homolog [Aricia agestis]|uniref:transmembrane protein 234 homolog n=1 Tax=Aricia agestis TaxID=91739 RepID=UPI001C207D6F|nr:transmembrane protein 234 homolog [Aricia agestis]